MKASRFFILNLIFLITVLLLLPNIVKAQDIDWTFFPVSSSNSVIHSSGVQDHSEPTAYVDIDLPGVYQQRGDVSGWGSRNLYSSSRSDFWGGPIYNGASMLSITNRYWEFSYDSPTEMVFNYSISPEHFSVGDFSTGEAEVHIWLGRTAGCCTDFFYNYDYVKTQDSFQETESGSSTFLYDPNYTYTLYMDLRTSAGWKTSSTAGEGHAFVNYGLSADVSVVPEPISSALFIVGGATLGFRRIRKKFKR